MIKTRVIAASIVLLALVIGAFNYYSEFKPASFVGGFPFKLGLDLNGGSELTYQADVSKVDPSDVAGSMQALHDVIENRINVFGVSEPVVETQEATLLNGQKIQKLIVQLPGVTNVNEAISIIGQTPVLEFRLVNPAKAKLITASSTQADIDAAFVPVGLTGRYLQSSQIQFDSQSGQPVVSLNFNTEGAAIFASTTKNNIGQMLAIFLDGKIISSPVIQQEIDNGQAQISGGSMTASEAKTLAQNLNYGALPVPITLIGTQTIGASLGIDALNRSVKAGIIGFAIIVLFLILWYRLPGLLAGISLSIYVLMMLAIFKLVPVTLTAAGLAGFVLSIGMAVDANILIFERMKEELRNGRTLEDATREGFTRAWTSIRDGNLSSIITAIILFWFSSTSVIKGFALIFGVGVLVSMITAISISRTFLLAVTPKSNSKFVRFLFSNGFNLIIMFVIKYRKIFYSFSALLVVISIASLLIWGLHFGVDFTGGSVLNVSYSPARPSLDIINAQVKPLSLQSTKFSQAETMVT